ncbi:MAG: hypothetical protein WC451_00480 [Patescibacteria group bacterium]
MLISKSRRESSEKNPVKTRANLAATARGREVKRFAATRSDHGVLLHTGFIAGRTRTSVRTASAYLSD